MNGSPQPEQPQVVAPMPVPLSFVVERVPLPGAPGGSMVAVQTFSATGQHVAFLPLDAAQELARQLTEAATGLTLPHLGGLN